MQIADKPDRFETCTGEMNWPMIAKVLVAMGCYGPVGTTAFASKDAKAALEAFRGAFAL